MTEAEAEALLDGDSHFAIVIPRRLVLGMAGGHATVEDALCLRLRGSYEPEEYDVVPLTETALYAVAIGRARLMADKNAGRFRILDSTTAEIEYGLRRSGCPGAPAMPYRCYLRIIRLKNPAPLEPDPFPPRSFDPTASN